ncbi:MAG: hypothetical protein ACYTGH_21310 [Planctomycetota bacterium]|jgi:L-alanine-DL-glutamate epimerase-like enolase superfamily enzyme
MVTITSGRLNFEREPLANPFGFKGGYLSELWQGIVKLEDREGNVGLGVGVQSVLWSDSAVFTTASETGGNAMMLLVTEYALRCAEGKSFDTPIDLLQDLIPPCYTYAKAVTGREDLRLTFVLNALVPLDNAAWMLYAKANGITSFDDMIPASVRPLLAERPERIGSIPLFTYGTSTEEIVAAAKSGTFFAKIKIGADPDQDGDVDKMVAWDCNRLTEIHGALKEVTTEYTDSGHLPYYLDANGRYPDRETLTRFLDHADAIGALDRIAMIEEPFPEEYRENGSGLPHSHPQAHRQDPEHEPAHPGGRSQTRGALFLRRPHRQPGDAGLEQDGGRPSAPPSRPAPAGL